MGDVSPSNSTEDEIVKFTVIRTSDAARKEVEMSISCTKLIDLKKKLAEDGYFGSKKAPVKRQRIFYLGRELKSGGRSLSNLGLGKFNNNILHLYIRPGKDGDDDDDDDDNNNNNKDIKEVSTATASAPPRKRRRKAERDEDFTERNRKQQQQNNIQSRTSNTNANNAIDLLDSSDDDDDDDEVEIIEVL
ncbi:hypothetical protein FRACYDRAFT_248316 [Fragilariopsis cylindrus CCMP1102]|uniref:Ubiquitin-like domain-containing protein n=1 Tax=Fragilariopsis cylindrus CCMP1102 TaxID=635003 RepID=A0A1E7EVA2_9STRA|nr:hypothetical protein FRACYDRAFT_248316 [Fragilariopsis cylindrus CCMP1102]|eukprot:OEU09463.1 hypothetical protein FRACYDRAFT_248316 [Fragilariopsis cylindrus CCMP1102]